MEVLEMQNENVFLATVPSYVLGIVIPIVAILFFACGVGLGIYLINKKLKTAGRSAEKIIEDANKKAEETRKEKILESKQEIHQLKQEANREINDRKKAIQEMENKVNQRELRLDNRSSNLDRREETLNTKERKIDDQKAEIDKLYNQADEIVQEQEKKLVEISGLNQEKAREIILNRVEEDMTKEISLYIKEQEETAKAEVKRKAQCLLANAIQQYSNEMINEKTVSVVALPNDEMKGRIIN